MDAETGEPVWTAGSAMASYSSPTLAEIHGTRQVLIFDAEGLAGFEPASGRELWRTAWTTDYDNNAAQPIVLDDGRVVISSAVGTGLFQLAVNDGQWNIEEIWTSRGLKSSYANPVLHEGFIYGLDNGILACLDLADGKRRWKSGRLGHGQLLISGNALLVLSEQGELVLIEANPEAYTERGRIQAIEGRTWNNPALVEGRAYVRNHLEMACYALPLAEGAPRGELDTDPPTDARDESGADGS